MEHVTKNNRGHAKEVLVFAGAYISMCIGASFGTGQEILQYFSSYGLIGVLGALLSISAEAAFIFLSLEDARKYKCRNAREMFIHYGGKYIGNLLYYYAMITLTLTAFYLIGGAGATAESYFGISNIAGSIITAVLVAVAVMLGLNKLIDILGSLASAIVVFMIVVAAISIFRSSDGLAGGSALALADAEATRPAGNIVISSFLYFTWGIMLYTSYVTNLACNAEQSIRVQRQGLVLGNVGFAVCGMLPALAMIANYSLVCRSQIPINDLAAAIHPTLGIIYSVIIIICIFTSISPFTWTIVLSVTKDEKSLAYKIGCFVFVALGVGFSSLGSFAQIVSFVGSFAGYGGILFLLCFLYTRYIRKPPVPAEK